MLAVTHYAHITYSNFIQLKCYPMSRTIHFCNFSQGLRFFKIIFHSLHSCFTHCTMCNKVIHGDIPCNKIKIMYNNNNMSQQDHIRRDTICVDCCSLGSYKTCLIITDVLHNM